MTAKRAVTIAVTGARLAAGAAIAVGCVLGVSAAIAAPWPSVQSTAAEATVSRVPGNAVLVCSGAFTAVGRDAQDASKLESVGSSGITVGASTGEPAEATLENQDVSGSAGAEVFTSAAEGRIVPALAAAEAQRLLADDLAGLAAGACISPSTESWIVGGSIETGAGDVLVLSNPGTVTATVTLTVFGAQPTSSTVVIAAQAQTAIPLASIAGGQTEPVVRVTAAGSPVSAVLQSALVDTLDPAGVDLLGATTVVSEALTFAGVQVVALAEGDATNALRLLSVDTDVDASVVVRDRSGTIAQEFTAPLTAGIPLDVALTDLDLGTYTVEVGAAVPLVAGIRQSSGTGAGTDFAWLTPAAPIDGETTFAVPSGPNPRLHMVGSPDGESIVTLTDATGTAREYKLDAGTSRIVSLSRSTVYTLEAQGAVSAAVMMAADGQLAGWPVAPGLDAEDDITVVH